MSLRCLTAPLGIPTLRLRIRAVKNLVSNPFELWNTKQGTLLAFLSTLLKTIPLRSTSVLASVIY